MKKIFLIFVVAAIIVSCKKDYTCECTTTPGNSTYKFTIKNVTKARAKANCVSTKWEDNSSGVTVTYEETCTLK